MTKEEIRRDIRDLKRRLTDEEKKTAADQAFRRLEQTEAFMSSENILLYHSLPDELSTVDFIDRWHPHKHLYLPRVNGQELEILPYDRNSLHSGAFNIEEPSGDNLTEIDRIELIIVPGIAYDPHGNRVGRGKGYYDRLLAKSEAIKIGVGYDFQIVDEIDCAPHDIAVDMIITDRRHLTASKKHR